jgi:transposase
LKSRTALYNRLRGLFRECGVAVGAGVTALKRALPAILTEEDIEISGEVRALLIETSKMAANPRSASRDEKLTRQLKTDERYKRLAQVPRVGPLAATALVATVGDAHEFRNGR